MSERVKIVWGLLLVAGAIALCFLSVKSAQQQESGSSEYAMVSAAQAKPAPNFRLIDAATGKPISLDDAAKSGPIVLDFWATWCGPCRAELPHIAALSRKYKGRAQFFGVNSNDSRAQIKAFLAQNPLPFPTLYDDSHALAAAYDASAIPLLVLIDRHGRARLMSRGYDPTGNVEGGLSTDLDTLIAEH